MMQSDQTPARRLLSAREAARFLGCHVSSIYSGVAAGGLRPVRLSSRLKFDVADLEAAIAVAKSTGQPILGGKLDKGKAKPTTEH